VRKGNDWFACEDTGTFPDGVLYDRGETVVVAVDVDHNLVSTNGPGCKYSAVEHDVRSEGEKGPVFV
jgi:hypothetical protein